MGSGRSVHLPLEVPAKASWLGHAKDELLHSIVLIGERGGFEMSSDLNHRID
ncbi:MAG: hypothetical protein JNL98_02565 [Bryobacterales bacterium]|nr:hypothetical protein [Bryobacterales bacterium]